MSEFDTSVWLKVVLREAANRDGTTLGAQKEKVREAMDWSENYINQFLPASRTKTKKVKPLDREQVATIATTLRVKNPFEDMLPPSLVAYPFCGEVEYGNFRVPGLDIVPDLPPIITARHPLYPKARPMAWLIKDNALGGKGYVPGTTALGVDFRDTKADLKEGNIVVIERVQAGEFTSSIERAIGMVKLVDDGIEVQPRSSDPKYSPIHIKKSEIKSGTSVKIRALIWGRQGSD